MPSTCSGNMWGQADKSNISLPGMDGFAWKVTDGMLTIVLDKNESIPYSRAVDVQPVVRQVDVAVVKRVHCAWKDVNVSTAEMLNIHKPSIRLQTWTMKCLS